MPLIAFNVATLMLLNYLFTLKNRIFAGRKFHAFCQNCKIRFLFGPQKSFLLNYVFSRPSITSVIRLSNNNIIFTETILQIEKRLLKHFPCGNCAIEFPRNILKVEKIDSHEIFVKAQFAKINSREILGKAQMANINHRELSKKKLQN